jgi:hypothetical protein
MKRTLFVIALLGVALLGYSQLNGGGEDQAFRAITIKDGPLRIRLNSKDFIELTDERFPGWKTQIIPTQVQMIGSDGRTLTLTPTGFGSVGAQTGAVASVTDTLANAIAHGAYVQGGIIVERY